MKLFLRFLPAATALLISTVLFSQSARPRVTVEPSWITKNTIDYNKTSLEKDAGDGLIDISFEEQVLLAEQTTYFRRSKRIISQAGVQNGSEISVSFDPSYEQLIFHNIRIIRGGETINKLQLSNIKTIQQEKELNNFIYNGSLNSVLILEDVRKGDVIEYSYSLKGFNPIFKNRYAEEYSMEFSIPVYDLYYKLIVPAGRKINIKGLNENINPTITSSSSQQVYEWRKTNVLPVHLQDYTPSWYDPYARILVSEYNSWKEVNDWAMGLFPVKKDLSPSLQKKIKEIESQYNNDAERTSAALRFVQDEIRYMGIEMGENSHKPADPSKVFAQRFGDCKEKSYLLCCMLRAMNINAEPVLISTFAKKQLNNLLPAPTDFDHLTVRVKLDNSYYWFDPTIAYQRGNIKNLFYPDYQTGLVVSDSTTALTPIAFHNVNAQHVKEYFKVTNMYGGGTLTVTTTSQGNAADATRSDFNNESIQELMNSYQKFYADYYDDIKADSLTYRDNDSTGTFITTEYYTIPKFWEFDKGDVKKFSFSPFIIASILKRPKEKDRKMPFRISFPAKYKEEVIVNLPENWKVTEGEMHLKNSCYSYNCKFYAMYNNVYLDADYENYKDHVTGNEAPAYFKDLNSYDEYANFDLTYGTEGLVSNGSHTSARNILLSFVLIGGLIGGAVWWSQRR